MSLRAKRGNLLEHAIDCYMRLLAKGTLRGRRYVAFGVLRDPRNDIHAKELL